MQVCLRVYKYLQQCWMSFAEWLQPTQGEPYLNSEYFLFCDGGNLYKHTDTW